MKLIFQQLSILTLEASCSLALAEPYVSSAFVDLWLSLRTLRCGSAVQTSYPGSSPSSVPTRSLVQVDRSSTRPRNKCSATMKVADATSLEG